MNAGRFIARGDEVASLSFNPLLILQNWLSLYPNEQATGDTAKIELGDLAWCEVTSRRGTRSQVQVIFDLMTVDLMDHAFMKRFGMPGVWYYGGVRLRGLFCRGAAKSFVENGQVVFQGYRGLPRGPYGLATIRFEEDSIVVDNLFRTILEEPSKVGKRPADDHVGTNPRKQRRPKDRPRASQTVRRSCACHRSWKRT